MDLFQIVSEAQWRFNVNTKKLPVEGSTRYVCSGVVVRSSITLDGDMCLVPFAQLDFHGAAGEVPGALQRYRPHHAGF